MYLDFYYIVDLFENPRIFVYTQYPMKNNTEQMI